MSSSAEPFLYLTTIGRVSGLPRTIEIWFVEHEGLYYVVAERREEAQWVKNLERNPRVLYRVGTRQSPSTDAPAMARVVRDGSALEAVRLKMDAKYGWSDGLVVEIAPISASPS